MDTEEKNKNCTEQEKELSDEDIKKVSGGFAPFAPDIPGLDINENNGSKASDIFPINFLNL